MARIWVLLVGLVLFEASAHGKIELYHGGDLLGSGGILNASDDGGVGLRPGPDGTYDPAYVLPTGGLAIADLTSGGIVTADMIPPADDGVTMTQYVETIAARISEPTPGGDPSPHQSLLQWPSLPPAPEPLPPDTTSNMASQTAQYLDATPGVTLLGGQIDGVFPQIFGDVQAVFNTLPIQAVPNLINGQ